VGYRVRFPKAAKRYRSLTASLLGAALCVLFVSSRSDAECARYVAYRDQNSHQASGRLEVLDFGLIGKPRNAVPHDRPAAPKPCSGALCSGSPAVPWAPIHTIPERVNQWAFLDELIEADRSIFEPLDLSDSILSSSIFVDSIFHPPRSF
jgi:hypothetical protein